MTSTTDAIGHVMDLIFSRWRSRTLSAKIELGVVEIVGGYGREHRSNKAMPTYIVPNELTVEKINNPVGGIDHR